MTSSSPPHRLELEVRFGEVDAYGIVWHGRYLEWLESARHRFAAHFGFDAMAALERGLRLPMLECSVEFRHPARFGDRVAVEITLDDDPRKVLAFRYEILRVGDSRLLARARTVQVVQGAEGELMVGWPSEITRLVDDLRGYDAGPALAAGRSIQNRVP